MDQKQFIFKKLQKRDFKFNFNFFNSIFEIIISNYNINILHKKLLNQAYRYNFGINDGLMI